MTPNKIIWLTATFLFGAVTYASFSGIGIPKAKKEKISVRDGSKRSGKNYRSTYPGGAYRYGK